MSLFDEKAFNELVDGNEELAKSLVELFAADWPGLLIAIEKAIQARDFSALEQAAHRLKGNARNFFADSVASKAGIFEKAGKSKQISDITEHLADLKSSLQQLQAELQVYLKKMNV